MHITMKTPSFEFRVFAPRPILLFAPICVLSTVLVVIALAVAKNVPPRAWLIAPLTLIVFWGSATAAFYDRWKYKKSISGYTTHCTTLRLGPIAERVPTNWRQEVEAAIEFTIRFWSEVYMGKEYAIRKAFETAVITFSDQPLKYKISGMEKLAIGLQNYNQLSVFWPAKEPWSIVVKVVMHEASHLCFDGACPGFSLTTDEQHKIMLDNKFPA